MNASWATVAAWVVGPPVVAALAVVVGDVGALGWPPPPSHWSTWFETADPAVAVTAILRLLVVVGCAVTALRVAVAVIGASLAGRTGAVMRRRRAPRSLQSALARIAGPTAAAGLGVGLVSSAVLGTGAAGADARTPGAAPVAVAGERSTTEVAPSPPIPGASFAEMRRVRIEFAPFADRPAESPEPEVWVVERGDHLWSIAEETLAEHLGEPPSEQRIARYWQRLIEANLDRLVIAGEPDVIMPGQRLVVPRPATGTGQRSGT